MVQLLHRVLPTSNTREVVARYSEEELYRQAGDEVLRQVIDKTSTALAKRLVRTRGTAILKRVKPDQIAQLIIAATSDELAGVIKKKLDK